MATTYEIEFARDVSASERQRIQEAVQKTVSGINNGKISGRKPDHIVFKAYDIVEADDPLVKAPNVGGYAMVAGRTYGTIGGTTYRPTTDEIRIDVDDEKTNVDLEEAIVHEVTHLTHPDVGGTPGGVHGTEFYDKVREAGTAVGIDTPDADKKSGATTTKTDGGKGGGSTRDDSEETTGGKGGGSTRDDSEDEKDTASSKDSGKPIVVDLDKDGLELVELDDSTARFDFDNDGFAEKTAWVAPDDGLLVFDIGQDGQVTEAKEIAFAYWTDDPNDTDLEGLRDTFDSNEDGKLNSLDTDWDGFRIWVDENQNGKTEEGELISLEEAGIESFDLEHREGTAEISEDGTVNHGLLDVEMTDGSISDGGDIAFAYESLGVKETIDENGNSALIFEGDTFEFHDANAGFTVADYEPLIARIFSMGFDGRAEDAIQYAVQNGSDVVFMFDSESVMTVEDVTLAQISEAFDL